jgi:hypothetical protein
MSDNQQKITQLMNYLAGRGYPTQISQDHSIELEVMRIIRSLSSIEGKTCKDVHNLLAGNWRLVFTTSEQLAILSSIAGGPLKVAFESIGDDTVHIAAPFKGFFLLIMAPVLIVVSLVFAIVNHLSFLGSFFVTLLTFRLLTKVAPSGIFASRRVDFKVTDDLIASSKLDRDVLGLFGSQFAFDKTDPDPMVRFCPKFDESNGTKDSLKVGFLFGWRIVPNPFCLHLKSHETVRREKVVYIDDNVRIMMGGDHLEDGSNSSAVSVYVRI